MDAQSLTVSVVTATYTFDRWDSLAELVRSVKDQTSPPIEIIVAVDHNGELAAAAAREWAAETDVTVVESRWPGDVGSAKNTGIEAATGDIVLFIDDDVTPPRDLIERLTAIFVEDPGVQAIGVAAEGDWEAPRPSYLPPEFDWILGCTYRGLPDRRGPMGRMVGSCMAARREALVAVRGFHADHHSDLDISHRLIDRYGFDSLVFDPTVAVLHHVPASRLSFRYLATRVFTTNRTKVRVLKDLGDGGNNQSDLAFVTRFLFRYLPGHLMAARRGGIQSALGGLTYIALAALGNAVGHLDEKRGISQPELTQGLDQTPQEPGAARARPALK